MTQSAGARYTRDMSQAGVPDPNVRAWDADRERIVEQLRQHTADGRLTMDEFEERMTAAYAAKTYRELAALTRDLPVDLGTRSGGSTPAGGPVEDGRPSWARHDWGHGGPFGTHGHGPFDRRGTTGPGENGPAEVVNALIGAAMDWKMQKQQFREQMRAQRHQVRLAKRAAQPIASNFAGWAVISTILTGIWFMSGVTSGGHFSDFWPIWPIGILGFFAVLGALKTLALRRELNRR
jgi:hypothetical protein